MKILLWVFLLCILLFFSLGNTIPLIQMPSHTVSKYKSPPDYYSDTMAIQGVFSKTIEPMSNAPNLDGSKLSNKTTLSTNMGRSTDLTQLKQPSKIQGRNPQPVQLRTVQSTSATNASTYPTGGVRNVPGSSCTASQYGCCDDGVTVKNADGTSCPVPASSCTASQYGCCDDGVTVKNADGTSCPVPASSCTASQYGCCDDGVTVKNADGTSCPAPASASCTASQYGCCDDGVTVKNADGTSCPAPASSCTASQYGCCDDGVTVKNADGTSCPAPASASCTASQYGCCDDGVTVKNSNGSNCAEYSPNKPSVYVLPVKPPSTPYPQNTQLTQPHDPYMHSEETVYLSPPMGKPAVPTCPTPQPCPPCGRCPEPSFECKKVPNYSSTSNVLPVPVLTDFSQFGM
jgi:hypothetical protein